MLSFAGYKSAACLQNESLAPKFFPVSYIKSQDLHDLLKPSRDRLPTHSYALNISKCSVCFSILWSAPCFCSHNINGYSQSLHACLLKRLTMSPNSFVGHWLSIKSEEVFSTLKNTFSLRLITSHPPICLHSSVSKYRKRKCMIRAPSYLHHPISKTEFRNIHAQSLLPRSAIRILR